MRTDLLTHDNLVMKRELQFMDIVNDEKDEDYSFVPKKIINHQISRQPCCQIHRYIDEHGKEVTKIVIT